MSFSRWSLRPGHHACLVSLCLVLGSAARAESPVPLDAPVSAGVSPGLLAARDVAGSSVHLLPAAAEPAATGEARVERQRYPVFGAFVGALTLMFFAADVGFFAGMLLVPPETTCDSFGCDYYTLGHANIGALIGIPVGLIAGGITGALIANAVDVEGAGWLVDAMLGGLVGLGLTMIPTLALSPFSLIVVGGILVPAGTIVGGLLGLQASRSAASSTASPRAAVSLRPILAPLPGGGLVGVASSF